VRHIGVSNFRIKDVENLLKTAAIRPVVNQVECNPSLPQHRLKDFCENQGILMSSYGALLPLVRHPSECAPLLHCLTQLEWECREALAAPKTQEQVTSTSISTAWPVSAAELLLRWQFDSGRAVVTTTSHPARLADYLAALVPIDSHSSAPRVPLDASQRISAASQAGSTFRAHWAEEFNGMVE